MKFVIPLGALLLLGIAAGVHRASGESGRPVPHKTREVEVSTAAAAMENLRIPVESSNSPTAPVSKPAVPEAVHSRRRAEEIPWRSMSSTLGRSLSLTPVQQGQVDWILRERVEEIFACHAEIRRAQVIDVQQYDWKVAGMKESWFKRIDAFLDADQHRQFVSMVEQGFFNEGLGFTVEPGMTVLD